MKTMRTIDVTIALGVLLAAGAITGCDRQTISDRTDKIPAERTVGEAIDDTTLAGRVKAALEADTVKFPDVKVSAFKGTVQLSGFVDESDQKGRAGDVAKSAADVKDVENNITVKK